MSSVSKTTKIKQKRSNTGVTSVPASSSAPQVYVLPLSKLTKKAAKTGSLSLPHLALEELKKLWNLTLQQDDEDAGFQLAPGTKRTVLALFCVCVGEVNWDHYAELAVKVWDYEAPEAMPGILGSLVTSRFAEILSPSQIADENEIVLSVLGKKKKTLTP